MGKTSLKFLQKGELDKFALLMHQHWMNKLKRSKGMSNNQLTYGINVDLITELSGEK